MQTALRMFLIQKLPPIRTYSHKTIPGNTEEVIEGPYCIPSLRHILIWGIAVFLAGIMEEGIIKNPESAGRE